jgi:alkanesulfonate monooxygenase SsuD/methylene tetrahydromethanopterin reductase-like flavin-dependent oxidoreductase (luciferase family)
MLDEGLSVLAGLWSGEPFSFDGQYYHVEGAQFLPTPVQQPRIPVWVGGFWPNKPPFRRAAHWDGAFPIFDVETEEQELAQLAEAVRYLEDCRKEDHPLEIISAGSTPGDDLARAAELVTPRADLGVTWWLEEIDPYKFGVRFKDEWPVEALRERVLQGPPVVG